MEILTSGTLVGFMTGIAGALIEHFKSFEHGLFFMVWMGFILCALDWDLKREERRQVKERKR